MLGPHRVARRGGEGAQVVGHEVRRARRLIVAAARPGIGPVAEAHVRAAAVDLAGLDAGEDVRRFGRVVDRAAAAPLLVGEQQRVGDVEIAVGGAVAALRVAARLALVPGHQRRREDRRMLAEEGEHAVEDGARVGVVPGHQRRQHHAVAVRLGDGEVARLRLGLDDVAAGAAGLLEEAPLPGVVEIARRLVERRLARGGWAGSTRPRSSPGASRTDGSAPARRRRRRTAPSTAPGLPAG